MKILINDNDFLIVNTINQLKKLVNEKPFEDIYNNDNHFLTNIYNFDGDLFDFDYFRLSGTIKRDIKTGFGILSNNFDFYDNNGNILFSFDIIDEKINKTKEKIDWLESHNKNYTKQQYNLIIEIQDLLK